MINYNSLFDEDSNFIAICINCGKPINRDIDVKIRSLFVNNDNKLSKIYLDSLKSESINLNDFLIFEQVHKFQIQSLKHIKNLFCNELNYMSSHLLVNKYNDCFWSLVFYFKWNSLLIDFLLRENHFI